MFYSVGSQMTSRIKLPIKTVGHENNMTRYISALGRPLEPPKVPYLKLVSHIPIKDNDGLHWGGKQFQIHNLYEGVRAHRCD